MAIFRSKKYIMITLIGLTALSLGSAAFSSWIFGKTQYTAVVDDVTITVADVIDNRLSVEILDTYSANGNEYGHDYSLSFDAIEHNNEGTIGALNNSTDLPTEEDLSFSFILSITHVDSRVSSLSVLKNITFGMYDTRTMTADSSHGDSVTSITGPLAHWSSETEGGMDGFIAPPMRIATDTAAFSDTDASSYYVQTVGTTDRTTDPDNPAFGVQADSQSGAKWEITILNDGKTNGSALVLYCTYKFRWGDTFNYQNPSYLTAEGEEGATNITNLKHFSNESKSIQSGGTIGGIVGVYCESSSN